MHWDSYLPSCFDDHVFLMGLRCFPMELSSLHQHKVSELLEQAAETRGNEHQRFIMQARDTGQEAQAETYPA